MQIYMFWTIFRVSQDEQQKNRSWKIQAVIDLVRNCWKAIERQEKTAFSINEQINPFLGRCRQFLKSKPRPMELKNFVVPTSDRIGTLSNFAFSRNFTWKYIPIFCQVFSNCCFEGQLDDFKVKIDATATIMPHRVRGFEFKKDNAINRGESEEVVRTEINFSLQHGKTKRNMDLQKPLQMSIT